MRTVEIPEYAKNIIVREITIESGMLRRGLMASSPQVATQSKPTKP